MCVNFRFLVIFRSFAAVEEWRTATFVSFNSGGHFYPSSHHARFVTLSEEHDVGLLTDSVKLSSCHAPRLLSYYHQSYNLCLYLQIIFAILFSEKCSIQRTIEITNLGLVQHTENTNTKIKSLLLEQPHITRKNRFYGKVFFLKRLM